MHRPGPNTGFSRSTHRPVFRTLEVTTDMDQPTPSLKDFGNVCSSENMANGEILVPFETIPPVKLQLFFN